MASHEEAHFDSFRKLCFALSHDVDDHFKNTTPVRGDNINLEIFYPILVVGGEILDVEQTPGSLKIERVEHIHFVQSYISQGKERGYHIGVVTEGEFPKLIATIIKETKETAKRIRKQRSVIRRSIDEIAKQAKQVTTQEEVQRIIPAFGDLQMW